MASLSVRVAGVWRAADPHVRVSGTWRLCRKAWARASGAWRVVWEDITIALTNKSYFHLTFGSTATSGVRLTSTGILQERKGSTYTSHATEWATPRNGTPGTAYEVRATVQSGTTPTGSSVGVWLALSSNREWLHQNPTSGTTRQCSLLVEIRPAGGGVVLTSATISIDATVEPL